MGSQGTQIAMPFGWPPGPSAPEAASFRIPYVRDKNAPKFITDSHENLLLFVDHVGQIFRLANMTVDAEKKKYFASLLTIRRKKLWMSFNSYNSGTFEDFLNEIYESYPEVKLDRSGSQNRFREICENYKGVNATTEGLLRRFGVEFNIEVEKLLKAPASITNVAAVGKYLETLDPNFARAIRSQIESRTRYRTWSSQQWLPS
ncbi:hypothetical protein B0H13DRAFT_1934049 [Mycena leptocephala]|nr:hypothetical protein B0H13DRAFT_1934049 [Mycena leptocephala]